MGPRPAGLLLACALVSNAALSFADTIVLPNEVRIDGVLASKTADRVALQVSENGYAYFEPAQIVAVELQSPAANDRLRQKWREDRVAEMKRDAAQKRFEVDQRAKGLVEYGDEWLTPKQVEARLAIERLAMEQAAPAPGTIFIPAQSAGYAAREEVFAWGGAPACCWRTHHRPFRPGRPRSPAPVFMGLTAPSAIAPGGYHVGFDFGTHGWNLSR